MSGAYDFLYIYLILAVLICVGYLIKLRQNKKTLMEEQAEQEIAATMEKQNEPIKEVLFQEYLALKTRYRIMENDKETPKEDLYSLHYQMQGMYIIIRKTGLEEQYKKYERNFQTFR